MSSELSEIHAWETTIPITKATTTAAVDRSTRPDLRPRKPLAIHFPNQRKGEAKLLPMPLKLMESRFPNHANQDITRVSGGSVGQLRG